MLQLSVARSTLLCAPYGLMHVNPGLVSIAMSEKLSKDQDTASERLALMDSAAVSAYSAGGR